MFKGELEQAEIKGIDLNDLYILEQGTRKAGAKKILVKHYGVENTGGLTNEELLNMSEVVKNGSVLLESFEKRNDGVRYAYEWDNNGVKLSLVIDDLNDGNKIFDFYSDRNFTDFRDARPLPSTSKDSRPLPTTLNEPNLTQKPLTSQEDLLKTQEKAINTQEPKSALELAKAEKLAKLESERLESEQEFLKAQARERARKEALKRKLEHERGNAGNIESATKIEVGEDIPVQSLAQIPKSRVRLNEREIYDLDYAIVKAKDLKPSFTTGGTQKRTDMNEEQIKSIAENFDPKKILGSGGFEDLPIILNDGQVIAGNHRVQGMLNFTPKSRYVYEKAIKEYYQIDLKPDDLLVRVPSKRLNNTEINNLAASSNQGRFNSESDHAIAVLSHYEVKLKELDKKLDADSIYSLKNIVAKNLNFDKATHPNVGDSNLALLMFNMPRTKTQGIELLNRWQKEFSNDIKSYEKVKKMFVDNAGSFHNLIHDMNFPNVSLNAYLSDIMDRSFANLKNYPSTSESLKDLSEKFYKTNSLEMFEKSDQSVSDISEILGGAIARFARFDDPSKALFEALKSDNIKKGLKEFKIADVTKDMFDPNSKEFKDIDIYDFTHYLLMVNREPNENNPTLKRLIQAVKDMQKEKEKVKAPSEWGHNYSEFKNDGLGAINKLLETKKGFVAGAFHKEGLGDIDLVWGNKDYGLEHILKRRIESYIKKGLKPEFAEQRALNLVRMIPEAIEKGKVGRDIQGRLKIETKDILVALRDNWQGEKLKNRWVITGFEKKVGNIRDQAKFIDPSLITKDGEHLASSLNSLKPNPTTNALKKQDLSALEQANAEKLAKLKHAITPLKEFGKNYPEFALKPKEALEKLLQEKNGQVAGAAFRDDLGGIDFVWGTPKTKDSSGYGLAHILEKREKQYTRLGLNAERIKERTDELVKSIPEVIENGTLLKDDFGHVGVELNNVRVGLQNTLGDNNLNNHFVVTSYERDEKVLRELETLAPLSNDYKGNSNYSALNLNEPNLTQKPLTSQEDLLKTQENAINTQEPKSALEQANAEKLAKLETKKWTKKDYSDTHLSNDAIKKLIDESPNNGKEIIVIGEDNLTPEIVEYIHKKHAKVGIERLDEDEITAFNFTYPKNAKAIIDYQGIQHALNKHGINSPSVKFSKQPPITYKDIANYRNIVKNADETIKRDNRIISYKQVNGHFVVVEQINRNKSEFIFKTMFKEKGDYKNAPDYKKNIEEND
ncbi:DUF3519 domain-containing protein [Helicobacter pylori]|uniref:DUF3519 domain-containing protein n=2 Tax=Helicobacter pylori TaxID=210 RepID=UPI00046CD1C9|nr:DUF3519 domain-containing protein [Helicobacter pylori]